MAGPRIDLRIGTLTLQGFDHRHQERLATALERELVRLWSEDGLPPRLVRAGRLELETARFEARPGDGPETAAAGLARSIAESVRAWEAPAAPRETA